MVESKIDLLRGLVSVDAEQAVLGGLMLDNDRWDDIALILKVEDFFAKLIKSTFVRCSVLSTLENPLIY